jgi:regulator of replication initiation timing
MKIQVIRIFTRIRQIITENTDIRLKIEKIKNKLITRIKKWKS